MDVLDCHPLRFLAEELIPEQWSLKKTLAAPMVSVLRANQITNKATTKNESISHANSMLN